MVRTANPEATSLASRHMTEQPGGFSLLEMVVALAIMGLLGALAMPSLQKITERTGFSLDLQDVERQLDQLPQIAASQGKALVLTSSPTDDGDYVPTPVPGAAKPYPGQAARRLAASRSMRRSGTAMTAPAAVASCT